MGCDIHIYMEYRGKGKDGAAQGWRCFGGRINPGRDYHLFGMLAGVRGGLGRGAIFPVRGKPRDMGICAASDAIMRVSEERAGSDGYIDKKTAEEWIRRGSAEWIGNRKEAVTHPDWHDFTWLTVEEFADVLHLAEDDDRRGYRIGEEYWAIAAALREIERRGDFNARVVFWFDN